MHPTRLISLGCFLAVALYALPALAGEGSLSVRLTDERGRSLNGTVEAKGSVTKTCTLVSGRCVIQKLKAGSYRVTVKLTSGNALAVKTIAVESDKSASMTFKAMAADQAKPPVLPGGAVGGTQVKTTQVVEPKEGQKTNPPPKPDEPKPLPDMGSGSKISISGRIVDSRGRSMNGTVEIYKDGKGVGKVTSRNGRFSIYDLPKGKYDLVIKNTSGKKTTKTVNFSSSAASVNMTWPN